MCGCRVPPLARKAVKGQVEAARDVRKDRQVTEGVVRDEPYANRVDTE